MSTLAGFRVLDLGRGMPSALATLVLADCGAEVIKVDPPQGDLGADRPSWVAWHRGKTVVKRDLADERQRADVERLAATADIVIETWRPGVADALGLGYSDVAARNPAVVYCSISGFGRLGPWSTLKGYEALVAARAGVMGDPCAPRFPAVAGASFAASQAALHGILASVYAGQGRWVETSLARVLSAFDFYGWLSSQLAGRHQDGECEAKGGRMTGSVRSIYPRLSGLLACTADGKWFRFANVLPHQLDAFVDATGLRSEWDSGEYGADEMDKLALERILQQSAKEWQTVFSRYPDIACERLNTTAGAMRHPQIVHNGHVALTVDGESGAFRGVGPLVQFLGSQSPVTGEMRRMSPDAPTAFQSAGRSEIPVEDLQGRPPLTGVVGLELGWFYAAPFGLACLADFGARVIKVETLGGDPFRRQAVIPELAAVKCMQGKESIALDLKTSEGKEIIRRLIGRSDLVMRSYRQRQSRAMGLDAETVQQINPDAVYLYAAAYGEDGPCADRPAYATTIEAAMGLYARDYGWESERTMSFHPPRGIDDAVETRRTLDAMGRQPLANADALAALAVTTAALLGLIDRRRFSRAPRLRTTMLCTNAYAVSDGFVEGPGSDEPLIRHPGLGISALYRLYETAAGWIFLACPQPEEWSVLISAFQRGGEEIGVLETPKFASQESRRSHDEELATALASIFTRRPAREWEELLISADVGCAEVRGGDLGSFTTVHPVTAANAAAGNVVHPTFGRHVRHGPLALLSGWHWEPRPGCLNGQQTRSILAELGFGRGEVEDLRARRVVGWPEDHTVPVANASSAGA